MQPESKIFGLGVRSFCAAFIVVATTLVLCYEAVTTFNVNNINVLGMSALSYLFGKASGAEETKKTL